MPPPTAVFGQITTDTMSGQQKPKPQGRGKAVASAPSAPFAASPNPDARSVPTKNVAKRSLVDEGVAARPAAKPRALRRRCTDEKVTKSLKDNFPTMTPQEIDGNTHSGLTLRETLAHDVRQKRTGTDISMGRKYYDDLWNKFRSAKNPSEQLQVMNLDEKVDSGLMAGMVAAKATPCNRSKLCQWLALSTSAPNQREVVGILKWCLGLRPSTSPDQMRSALAALEWCSRQNIKTLFPGEFGIARSCFDEVLVQAHKTAKKSATGLHDFLKHYAPHLALVLPMPQVHRIMAETENWMAVASELNEVIGSSEIGQRLFGWAISHTLSSQILMLVDTALAELAKQKRVSKEDIMTSRRKLTNAIEEIPNIQALGGRRTIKLQYRAIDMTMPIASIAEEVEMRVMCFAKSHAAASKELVSLFCEDDLCGPAFAGRAGLIDPDVLAATSRARKEANAMLVGSAASDGETVKALLQSRENHLLSLDSSMNIEVSFLIDQVGAAGGRRLQDLVIGFLPTKDKASSVKETIQALATLKATEIFRFASQASQSSVGATLDMLTAIAQGRRPSLPRDPGHFLSRVVASLQFFVQAQGDDDNTLFGHAAVMSIWERLKAQSEPLSLADCEPLNVFAFLLSPGDQKSVMELTKNALGMTTTRPRASASKAQDASEFEAAADMFS